MTGLCGKKKKKIFKFMVLVTESFAFQTRCVKVRCYASRSDAVCQGQIVCIYSSWIVEALVCFDPAVHMEAIANSYDLHGRY